MKMLQIFHSSLRGRECSGVTKQSRFSKELDAPLDTTTLEDNKKRKNHKGDCRSRINRSFAMTDDGKGDCHGRFTASQ